MVRFQLMVAEPHQVPQLCVLAGPTFRDLLAGLRLLRSRVYVAPHFWIVDAEGIAWLRAAGLKVEEGSLEPALQELAHRATLGLARDWLPLVQSASEI
jgi:hypothetical protein